jgi:hypothetical protein
MYGYVYTILQTHLRSASYPPRPQWQGLDPHDRRLNVSHKSDYANDNTQNIHNVITVPCDLVNTATVETSVLVCLASTSKCLGNGCAFEKASFGRISGWQTGSCSEHVDSLENEEARESAAEVGYTGIRLARYLVKKRLRSDLRSKKRHVRSADDWI